MGSITVTETYITAIFSTVVVFFTLVILVLALEILRIAFKTTPTKNELPKPKEKLKVANRDIVEEEYIAIFAAVYYYLNTDTFNIFNVKLINHKDRSISGWLNGGFRINEN